MSNSFIASARKYRPATFDTVVGQSVVTGTLKNAIRNNQVTQAYLFCGPRGVGKTTCARILAKTLNCFNRTADIEACNECESCKSFNEGRSYNIHELDAASNNSVEDIRTLIDQVRIPPQVGKYSIYIIDEVHMLSTAAFNAFLKTLEEPPAHVIFILATTEKNKILPTILSRCQVFDFNRIKIEDTVGYLQKIAADRGLTAEADGLHIIAQKADGGMRDALSIFDQIVSYCGNHLAYKDVIANLNVLDYEYYFKLCDAFLDHNIAIPFNVFNDILDKGFDGHNFVSGLSSHFRDLMVCKDPVTLSLLEVGANIRERYREQAARCSIGFLYDALNVCNACDMGYKVSKNQRLHVELMLLRLSQIGVEKKKSDQPLASGNNAAPTAAQPVVKAAPKPVIPTVSVKINATPVAPAASAVPATALPEATSAPVATVAEPLTTERVVGAWNAFAERHSHEPPNHSLLTSATPTLASDVKVSFPVANAMVQEMFRKLQPELVTFLRTTLGNPHIELETRIVEIQQQNIPQKAFTLQDKFVEMTGKNPALNLFKQRFVLDFE